MSNLSAFLHPAIEVEEKDVVISDRFQEDGKPVPFRIRPITQEENDRIAKQCRRTKKINGQPMEYIDQNELSCRLIVAGTVIPDFRSKEMCDQYGVIDPFMVPAKMLYSGEFSRLMKEISKISGFENDVEEEAKN